MKSPYMNIKRIEFIVTYNCSGKCKHCSLGEDLNSKSEYKHVLIKQSTYAIDKLCEIYDIASVMTFGGEPLLYPDIVNKIHKTATLNGVKKMQLITNGFFTKNEDTQIKVVESLKEAGLNNLLISVDAFHEEYIPYEVVYNFAKHAKESGIKNVRLHPAWVVDEKNDNEYNRKTNELLNKFSNLNIEISNGNNIFLSGNAAKNLAKYYDKTDLDLNLLCGSMPYTEPLTSISSISIVPNGDVMVCGFVIGNIYKDGIEEIVSNYDPFKNEYMNIVVTSGAKGLLKLANNKNINLNLSQYFTACDLCFKLAKELSNNL